MEMMNNLTDIICCPQSTITNVLHNKAQLNSDAKLNKQIVIPMPKMVSQNPRPIFP